MKDDATPLAPALLSGSGEMRTLVRTHNWASSPLGPAQDWPHTLKTIVDVTLDTPLPMIVLWGSELTQIYNDCYATICGPKHPRALGQPTRECWPEVWSFNAPIYAAVLKGESRVLKRQTLTINRNDRPENAWFDLSYSPLRNDLGKIAGVLVTAVEVTAHVLSERRVIEGAERQRRLFEKAPGFISVLRGPDHVFEFANETNNRLTGRGDTLGKPVREAFPDLGGQGYFELLDQVYATGERYVVRGATIRFQPTADDPPKNLRLDFIYEPILDEAGRVTGIFCEGHDVTEAHLAQEALREAESATERMAERERVWRNSLDVLVVADGEGVFLAVSPAWTRVLGHDVSEVVGRSFRDFILDEDVEQTTQAVAAAATGADVHGFENRYRHKDGSPRLLAWRTSAEDGLIYGYARDVTAERAQAADLAKRVFERERLWSTNPMLFAVAAFDSTILEVNPAWTAMLGWTPDDLIGRSYAEYVHPDDAERSLDWARRLASGLKVEELVNRYRCKDGGSRWIAWAITADNEVFHCVGRDVTEQRAHAEEMGALESTLRQSQKLEAIGQLTGGVAHDFNNLLTVIRGSAELLMRPNVPEEKRRRYINAIADTSLRATKLTNQLLAFARRQALKPEVFNVGQSVLALSDMVGTIAGGRIQIDTRISDEPCFIDADPSQFDTALVNMAVNARDAMNGEGRLTIQVKAVSGMPEIRAHPARAGDFVAVSLTDTGSGIPTELLEQIFQPFFTTKGVGHGTGLGLSQVFGFTKQSGGEVQVKSAPGEGSTFSLYLPRVSRLGPVSESLLAAGLANGEGARVLVVEDNADVGAFSTQTLEELGYQTVLAGDARQALALLADDAAGFDVVFSDVIMPGMDGIELGLEIGRLYTGLPVVLTSGYSHVLAEEGTSGLQLLHKPYSIEQLSQALGDAAARRKR